jgi:hypothetical protein
LANSTKGTAQIITTGTMSMDRQEAADALSGVRFPAAVDALIKALDDDEPLVRCSAVRASLATCGLAPEPMDPQAAVIRGDVRRPRAACGRQARHSRHHRWPSPAAAVRQSCRRYGTGLCESLSQCAIRRFITRRQQATENSANTIRWSHYGRQYLDK